MRCWMILAALLIAPLVHATSLKTWERGEPVSNPQWTSDNGRFTVVVREYERLGDFETLPAEKAFGWDEPQEDEEPLPQREPRTFAFYDGRTLIAIYQQRERLDYRQVLVPDSGRSFVLVHLSPYQRDALFTMVRRDGSSHRVMASDIFSPDDRADLELSLRDTPGLAGDIVRLDVQIAPEKTDSIRIDAVTGQNLDPEKRDLLPVWTAWSIPAANFPEIDRQDVTMQCAAGVDPSRAVRIAPRQLHARAVERPLPAYPTLARKVRLYGWGHVEVVVDTDGRVVCTRAAGSPFGIKEAAEEAVRRWRFEPYLVDGRPVLFTSDVQLRFERVPREARHESR